MKCLKIKDILLNINPEKVPVGINPYIEIGDIDVSNKTYQYKDKKSVSGAKYALKNSIIVSTVRPTRGAIAIIQEDKIAVSNAFAILSVDEKQCNYKYLFYMINSNKFYDYLGSNSKGATYPTCSREDVYNYEITLPSLKEQNKIVKIFDNIFTSIDIKNKQIDDFNQLIKSQFSEMFGNGNYPNYKWNDVFNTTTGKLDSNAMVPNGKYPFFTCAKEGFWIDEYAFDCEALMLAGNNAAGIYDVKHYKGKFNAYQRTYVLTLKNNKWKYELFKLQLEDKLELLRHQSKGSNTRYLTMKILNDLDFKIPPVIEQERFTKIVEQIDKQKFEFEKQLEKLKELQESLMKEYFG